MNQQTFQTWASLVVAACAVLVLGAAVYQNQQIAGVLGKAADAFRAQTYPVVRFHRYQWNPPPGGASCENPALGVNVSVRNVSRVPVYLEKFELAVLTGEREIESAGERDGGGTGILAPGQNRARSFEHDEFPGLYKGLKGPEKPPYLRFKISVRYRSLVTDERSCYEAAVQVLDDCSRPRQKHFNMATESLTPCAEDG